MMGEVELEEDYSEALDSLDSFSHAILLYWFHRAASPRLRVTPYLDRTERGLFSTRAPSRPNPIGISIVELVEVGEKRIVFRGADMLNDTPLIDIKPFIPEFDNRPDASSGWLANLLSDSAQPFDADRRFEA
jgi:tRNA-Thr(GGU) m(6)t(6)A37 methyltransferase TsaA